MTPYEREAERRRAIAGLNLYIDVLSSWLGRYEDDDRPASIAFITAVIPQIEDNPPRGWLCVRGTATPGIGWRCETAFGISSLCRSFRGTQWPVTRRLFREAARKSGVCLPSRHATWHLDKTEKCYKCWEPVTYDEWVDHAYYCQSCYSKTYPAKT